MPPEPFIPALLLLLLTSISATRLPLSPHFPLNAPHPVHRLTRCLPPGRNRLLGVSHVLHCPCVLRFKYTRPPANLAPRDALDFLLVDGPDIPNAAAGLPFRFNPRYSILAARLHPPQPNSSLAPTFDSQVFTIPDRRRVALALRSSLQAPDCSARVELILERQTAQCPIVLPSTGARPLLTRVLSPLRQLAASSRVAPPAPRIVGGNIPHPSLQSHMAAFVVGGSFVCSGSLISARWAITAAHCKITRAHVVIVGSSLVGADGTILPVARVIAHSRYEPGRQDSPYDIALVELSRAAPSGTKFIMVNDNTTVPEPGAFSRAFGYGQTIQKQSGAPRLRQVDVPVVPMNKCKQKYSSGNAILASGLSDELQLCAGRVEGGCDACQGDSGGPLAVFDSEDNLVQIGVVSFGIGCARAGFPGVYTRLSFFHDWMVSAGAEFTRSSDGRTVFAEGSSAALGSGFSIAGLNEWQSIALLCGAGIAVLAFVVLVAYPIVRRKGRRRRRDDQPDFSSDAPQSTSDGETTAHPEYSPEYSPSRYYPQPADDENYPQFPQYRAPFYESHPLPPYTEPHPLPPYTEPQAPPIVYGARSFEYGNRQNFGSLGVSSTREEETTMQASENAQDQRLQGAGQTAARPIRGAMDSEDGVVLNNAQTAISNALYPSNSNPNTAIR